MSRVFPYRYTADNDQEYIVHLKERTAQNGLFQPVGNADLEEFNGGGRRKMRHVGILLDDGRREVIPCPTPTGGIYVDVGVELTGLQFRNKATGAIETHNGIVTGRVGEKGGPT